MGNQAHIGSIQILTLKVYLKVEKVCYGLQLALSKILEIWLWETSISIRSHVINLLMEHYCSRETPHKISCCSRHSGSNTWTCSCVLLSVDGFGKGTGWMYTSVTERTAKLKRSGWWEKLKAKVSHGQPPRIFNLVLLPQSPLISVFHSSRRHLRPAFGSNRPLNIRPIRLF